MKVTFPRPSKTSLYLGVYGFLLYLVFMFADIPAQQVWHYVPQNTKTQLQLAHIQGTVWSGQVDDLKINNLSLGQMHWGLNLLPLFIGQLNLDAQIKGMFGSFQSSITIDTDNSLTLTNFTGDIPAESLNPYTLPATLDGKIQLNINHLVYQANQQLQLEGEAFWRKASISMLQTIEIGNVHIISKADGDGSIIQINNEKSALGIEGTIKLKPTGRYEVNLALMNRDSNRKDISSLLPMLGRLDAAGKVYIKRQGQLLH